MPLVTKPSRGKAPLNVVSVRNADLEAGGVYITDTDAHTGDFCAITVHAAAVAALVSSNITGTLTAVVLPVGLTMFGRFSSITLASGKITAYKRK